MSFRWRSVAICIALIGWLAVPAAARPVEVVFVCEHGVAKSVVAAELFKRMAAARGLSVHVVSRGTAPESAVPPALADNLRKDGYDVRGFQPQRLSPADTSGVNYLVGFGVPLPQASDASVIHWDDVPALSDDYASARDAIAGHLADLVNRIASATPPARKP